MTSPSVIVVSGPAGSGKTTLAQAIGRVAGCPVIDRDELKEGMAFSIEGYQPQPGDVLAQRTYQVFFDVLELLLRAGVTVVADAAFLRPRMAPGS